MKNESEVSKRAITNPKLYIGLIGLGGNIYSIPNELILDNFGSTYSIKSGDESKLNGQEYTIPLGFEGLLTILNAVNEDRVLEVDLQEGETKSNFNEYLDTPYGFKLSEVMNNMGDVTSLTPTNTDTSGVTLDSGNGWTNMGHLIISQKAFSLYKGYEEVLVFTFNIKNVGSKLSQNILFKDLLPKGVTLRERDTFVKYSGFATMRLTTDNYTLKNNRLLYIKLNDIKEGGEATITFVCTKNSNVGDVRMNIGALSYVAYQCFDNEDVSEANNSTTVLVNLISNSKSIDRMG